MLRGRLEKAAGLRMAHRMHQRPLMRGKLVPSWEGRKVQVSVKYCWLGCQPWVVAFMEMASGVKIQSEFPGGNCFHAGNAKLGLEPRCNSFELSLVCVLCHLDNKWSSEWQSLWMNEDNLVPRHLELTGLCIFFVSHFSQLILYGILQCPWIRPVLACLLTRSWSHKKRSITILSRRH